MRPPDSRRAYGGIGRRFQAISFLPGADLAAHAVAVAVTHLHLANRLPLGAVARRVRRGTRRSRRHRGGGNQCSSNNSEELHGIPFIQDTPRRGQADNTARPLHERNNADFRRSDVNLGQRPCMFRDSRGLHGRAASPICAAGVGRTVPSPTRSDPEGSSRNDFVPGRSGSHPYPQIL